MRIWRSFKLSVKVEDVAIYHFIRWIIVPNKVTTMENSYTHTAFAKRLRQLHGKQDWTVQEMADLAGIPKRSLENYMRKSSPQVPSVEVLVKMSIGYGVPADWLLFGAEGFAIQQSRLVRLCTRTACEPFVKGFLQATERLRDTPEVADVVIKDGRLLGQTPEAWAMLIAGAAGETAEALLISPTYNHALEVAEKMLGKKVHTTGAPESEMQSKHETGAK